MAVGRLLSTDTADLIGNFGQSIGRMRGDMLDYERSQRLREALEARLKKEAADAELTHDKSIRDQILLMSEMPAAQRELYAKSLSPELRGGMGYRPEVPALDMEIQPPATPDAYVPPGLEGPASVPHEFETPGVAAVDPFEGYEPAGKFTYMGGEYGTEEERNRAILGVARAQKGLEPGETASTARAPTHQQIQSMLEAAGAVTPPRRSGQPPTYNIPAADYAQLYEDVRTGKLSLSDIPAEVQNAMPRDTTERRGATIPGFGEQPEDDGPGILGRIGGWIADRYGEVGRIRRGEPAEPEMSPPVQVPMPTPQEFSDRGIGSGIWEPRGENEFGADMGPGLEGPPAAAPDSLAGPSLGELGPGDVAEGEQYGEARAAELAREHPAADVMETEQFYEMIGAARANGWSDDEIVEEIMASMGVDELEAREILAQAGG